MVVGTLSPGVGLSGVRWQRKKRPGNPVQRVNNMPVPQTNTKQPKDNDETKENITHINQFLRTHPRVLDTNLLELISIMKKFVQDNEIPSESPNFRKVNEADDLSCIFFLLCDPCTSTFSELTFQILQLLKVLFRKQLNRKQATRKFLKTLISIMSFPRNGSIAAEACNVVLNMCYDTDNVKQAVDQGIIPTLLSFLVVSDVNVQSSACGALQSLCYKQCGREKAIERNAVPKLVYLLDSKEVNVRTRAIGALHNISSGKKSILQIKNEMGLPKIIKFLNEPNSVICSAAAGTIQNLSRDEECRKDLIELEAVDKLSNLLFSNDMQTQASAAGALLNMACPVTGDEQRQQIREKFRQILTDSITLGIAYTSIFSETSFPHELE